MAAINQKEYLKKYLGIGKSEKKKKKKPKIYGDRLKIVDDNIDVSLSQEIQEDIDAGNEDAPLIVSVIDDTKGTMWQPIGSTASTGTGNSQLIVDTFKLNKSANETSLAKSVKHKADLDVRKKCPSPDVSPPRRRDMTPPLRVKQERISPDTSPPRNRDSDDISPPRKRNVRYSDMSLPTKRNIKDDQDVSPPRRKYNRASDVDSSPPSKTTVKREHSHMPSTSRVSIDISPPRRKRNDVSLSRRQDRGHSLKSKSRWDNERSSSSKLSSPDSYSTSKDRSSIKDKDISPLRKRTHRDKDRERDVSPARRKHRDSGETRRRSTEKMERTMSGKKAGLQSAKNLVEEIKNLQKREEAMFNNMSEDVLGVHAATIVRKRKKEEDPEELARKLQREQELKEKYDRWGKGLKQMQDETARIVDAVHEMNKPLARYADDTDLEKHLKEQEREGDPMLDYIKKKKKKKNIEAGIPEKPVFMGEFMPNRFGIRPGYRWDGVDRSNGYEKRWFENQNKKKALQEEAHKWSTEDM